MTLVIDALTRAARECSIDAPSSWITATATEYLEIRDDFLSETVEDILERVDVPSPVAQQYTIPTDGSESYALPTNFFRMQRGPLAVYETTTSRRAVSPISSDSEWTHLAQIGSAGGERFYKVEGYDGNHTISLYQNPSSSIEVIVSYISKNWMGTAAGVAGYALTADTDVILFPRRLVEAGIVWRWRRRKGLPYDDVMVDYEILMSRLSNDSRGRRTVNFGEPVMRKPWDVPVPSEIPSS